MSKPILVIYNLQILYDLLKEIKEIINFEILIYSEKEHLENLLKTKANYLIISNINLKNPGICTSKLTTPDIFSLNKLLNDT